MDERKTIELLVDRKWKKETYTIGNLYVNGEFFCNTLEDKDRGLKQTDPRSLVTTIKVYGETAIPTGRYHVRMDMVSHSFRFRSWATPYGGKLPRLENVTGFDGVLIHVGNQPSESLGCILVGDNTKKGLVLQSAKRFHELMQNILVPAYQRGDEIYITIK